MTDQQNAAVLTPAYFLDHWQGHRRLTRRVIEAFPGDQLFGYSLGGMRTFGTLAWEMHGVAAYTLNGLRTDRWGEWDSSPPEQTRPALLTAWDGLTARLDAELPQVDPGLYPQVRKMFWGEMPIWVAALYAVENEIHHRGQGYVYLRTLGIEPPAFYER